MADDLAVVGELFAAAGEAPAVILVSTGGSVAVAQELAGAAASLFASDVGLLRTEVAALDGLDPDQLTVVRRVDDLRRPEQAGYAERLTAPDSELESTFFSAESYELDDGGSAGYVVRSDRHRPDDRRRRERTLRPRS